MLYTSVWRQDCPEALLRKKMRTATASHGEASGEEPSPARKSKFYQSRNALKNSRKIELGWIHEGKEVRKRSGGGTRILDVHKNKIKKDILSYTKELFFPQGESNKGKWEDFIHDIFDFKESRIDESTTVGELYSQSKFGILRFYLSKRCHDDLSDTGDGSKLDRPFDTNSEQQRETDYSDQHQERAVGTNESQTKPPNRAEDSDHGSSRTRSDVVYVMDLTSLSYDSEVFITGLVTVSTADDLDDTVPVFLSPEEAPTASTPVLEEHVEYIDHSSLEASSLPPVHILLHRVNLLEETICYFKDECILNCSLKYSYINEKGADVEDVARDFYAAFWTEFVDCPAEGAEMKEPSLSPKWQEEEWKAVGRILAKGFLDQGYFPLHLAPAFTTALILGEHAVSAYLLFDSLLFYLSQCERDLIATALKEDLASEDQDELLDLLDRVGVKMVPSQDSLKAILHK